MFRQEFAQLVSSTGMLTMKDLMGYLKNKEPNKITELEILQEKNFDPIKFAQIVSAKYKIKLVDLSRAKISDEIMGITKKAFVSETRCIPLQKTPSGITLAIYDPTVVGQSATLKKFYGTNVNFVLTDLQMWREIFIRINISVDEIIDKIREIKNKDEVEKVEGEKVSAEDIGEDVIRFVNTILAQAYIQRVSDIHIEPYEKTFRVRFRIDGSLAIVAKPPINLMLPIISRIKIMADLDISEKRKPQDGRIKLEIAGEPIDYRVSSLPTLFGEKIVLRLLDQSNLQLDMTKLGMETKQMNDFKESIHRPFGMCLVTGPTGSGKTTTLYSALSELNEVGTNVSTAEDPVEFNLDGINQVNVKKDIGLTFSTALKAFLRQDPDIIMVGEIRDFEVGEIAVEAALTGHLVLSTLHTNDAPSTITRLLNMGIEPFLITGSLNSVVAQRLCRRICPNCREEEQIPRDFLIKCGIAERSVDKVKMYRGIGCKSCGGSGYKGRVAIYEVLLVTPKVKDVIIEKPSAEAIKSIAIKEGMKTLRMAGLTKAAQGMTTVAEVLNNSGPDD